VNDLSEKYFFEKLSTMEITDIKQQLTLAQVLQHYNLKPDKNLRLHCPFHEDKTPSLQVYYKTHTAYCFSSNCKTHGKSLDVIDFVMHKENTDKHNALLKCAEIINYFEGKVQHQQKPIQAATNEAALLVPKLRELTVPREQFLQNMFTYFKNAVHNSKPAQEYLQQRGLDPLKIEVGYNTAQFHHGARKDETLINNCVAVGLLAPWGTNTRQGGAAYKPFAKYCIVFALRNQSNHVTGLYFRSTENNTDQRHFYLKDRSGLYPCYPKSETKKLILTESIIDAATLLQVPEIASQYSILALYGTNGLTEEHQTAIKELSQLEEMILWLNADEPGEAATKKHAETLRNIYTHIHITHVNMPSGEDINSLQQSHSNEQIFIDLLNERTADFFLSTEKKNEDGAKLLIDTTIERKKTSEIIQQHPTQTLDTSNPYKLRYTTDAANYFIQGGLPKTTDNMKVMLVIENKQTELKARNKIDLYEDKQVERLCKEAAEKLQLRKDLLEADLYRLTDLLETHIEKELKQNNDEAQPLQVLTIKERSELESFAKKPKLIERLNELLGQTGIVGEERNRIFLLIIAISHKMPETLHALIQGSSGSGKTRLLKQISDCIPKENVTKLTRLSDKVLYNFPENYFINRLLCLEDIDGLSEEAEFAFRELQSNGELNSATSIKLENGQITSGQKTVRGPIASIACTTHGEIYEDNMSRVFLIAVDESIEQTKRIIEYQNKKAAGLIDYKKEQEIKTFLQKFISTIQAKEVINPFAEKIQLPEEAQKIRRLNDLFQSFVKMITILNQYQRKSDERKRLVTEIEDIETAVAVMFESIVLKVDELDGSLRQFYEQLKSYLQKQYNGTHKTAEFSLREIRHALKSSKTQVFRYANDLTNLEYIKQCGGYSNKGFTYKICYWDNYQNMREKIKQNLDEQVKALKAGTLRNATGTLEPA
jgi:DNA primase